MGCFVAVPQDKIYVIETCGDFKRLAGPGFQCVGVPGFCSVIAKMNIRIQQMTVAVETKTKDNVFVYFLVAVQYQVMPAKVYEAFYTLTDPVQQIQSYVFDVVRASVPQLNLDDVFASKDQIAQDVKSELQQEMNQYGYDIKDTLVIDVKPNILVQNSMNQINANKRLRVAAHEKAEAEKVRIVKEAEAEAESKYLQGVGLARQRKAIIDGLRQNVESFSNETHVDSKSVMDLVMISQYFDTLKDITNGPQSQCIYYHDEGGEEGKMMDNMRSSLLQAKVNVN